MSDFWTRKLGNPQFGRTGRQELASYPQQPATPAQTPYPQQPAQPYAPPGAQHLRQHIGTCPACDSADYVRPGLTAQPRCYTCGYPVLHSTSGVTVPKGGDQRKIKPARQIAMSTESGFNPKLIIARIGGDEE